MGLDLVLRVGQWWYTDVSNLGLVYVNDVNESLLGDVTTKFSSKDAAERRTWF